MLITIYKINFDKILHPAIIVLYGKFNGAGRERSCSNKIFISDRNIKVL